MNLYRAVLEVEIVCLAESEDEAVDIACAVLKSGECVAEVDDAFVGEVELIQSLSALPDSYHGALPWKRTTVGKSGSDKTCDEWLNSRGTETT